MLADADAWHSCRLAETDIYFRPHGAVSLGFTCFARSSLLLRAWSTPLGECWRDQEFFLLPHIGLYLFEAPTIKRLCAIFQHVGVFYFGTNKLFKTAQTFRKRIKKDATFTSPHLVGKYEKNEFNFFLFGTESDVNFGKVTISILLACICSKGRKIYSTSIFNWPEDKNLIISNHKRWTPHNQWKVKTRPNKSGSHESNASFKMQIRLRLNLDK